MLLRGASPEPLAMHLHLEDIPGQINLFKASSHGTQATPFSIKKAIKSFPSVAPGSPAAALREIY